MACLGCVSVFRILRSPYARGGKIRPVRGPGLPALSVLWLWRHRHEELRRVAATGSCPTADGRRSRSGRTAADEAQSLPDHPRGCLRSVGRRAVPPLPGADEAAIIVDPGRLSLRRVESLSWVTSAMR
jgi:hypothetical protein